MVGEGGGRVRWCEEGGGVVWCGVVWCGEGSLQKKSESCRIHFTVRVYKCVCTGTLFTLAEFYIRTYTPTYVCMYVRSCDLHVPGPDCVCLSMQDSDLYHS